MDYEKRRFGGFRPIIVFLILVVSMVGGFEKWPLFGRSIARADIQGGRVGQMAPELNLSNWIDGNGRNIEPIRLGDLRGKVIYLYFFQDW